MAGTVTATADLTNARIGVQLGSWAAPDGPVTVKRVHPDTTEWTVRGLATTSGGAAFVYDYEAPFNVSVYYYAYDGAVQVPSSLVSLPILTPRLRGPGLPGNDATFEVIAKPTVKYPRPRAVLTPIGRSTPIVLSGARQAAGEFAITVETHSDQEATTLLNTVTQSSTCLLLIPGVRAPWRYVQVGDVTEVPFSPWLSSANGDPGSWAQFTLDCVATDAPVGGVFGDPSASYTAVRSTYADYTALRTAKASYLNILQGVP